jgi:hypothetical protein
MEDAKFAGERLRTQCPRLRHKYQQVADQERYDKWAAAFDPLKPRHAAAVARLREVWQRFAPELVAALTEARAVDAVVHDVMAWRPHELWQTNADGRILLTVERAARPAPQHRAGTGRRSCPGHKQIGRSAKRRVLMVAFLENNQGVAVLAEDWSVAAPSLVETKAS